MGRYFITIIFFLIGMLFASGQICPPVAHGAILPVKPTNNFSAAQATPGNLKASAAANSIMLAWEDKTGGNAGVKVERRQGTGPYQQITEVAKGITRYTDAAAKPGINYTYRVRAFAGELASPYSNEASATITAAPISIQKIVVSDKLVFSGGSMTINTDKLVYSGGLITVNTGRLVYSGGLITVNTDKLVFSGGSMTINTGKLVFSGGSMTINTGKLVFSGRAGT